MEQVKEATLPVYVSLTFPRDINTFLFLPCAGLRYEPWPDGHIEQQMAYLFERTF